jgi:3-hydroxyacyl-CoA dehydrogenase
MTSLVQLERHGRIGVLRIANPPVNALSDAVVAGMKAALAAFASDPAYDALLIHCDGRSYIAGADITVFDQPGYSAAPFNAMLDALERERRLVVTLLHGTALGGGLEVALACHYRAALADARVGLPEVTLGLLPGSGGTQRLPRLTGAPFALAMMLDGRMVGAADAHRAGMIDALVSGEPLQAGLAYAEALLARAAAPRRASALPADGHALPAGFLVQAHADAQRKVAYPAVPAIVQAVEAAVTLPYADGAALEARLFLECVHSRQSQSLRHLFFAERQAARVPGLDRPPLRPIARVGVVGAGTMGSGIAMNFLNAGIATVVVEASAPALERGLAAMRRQYEASAAKGRITPAQLDARLALLHGSVDYAALADCDLVIEAVYEDMALKRQVCGRLGEVCKPGAIIATNTSTLDVDLLAEASGRPGDVVGMHFFSPANVMRLLEVVRGARTAPDVLATAMKLASTIRKVAVVSGVCYGFIGNRMLDGYLRETEFLLLEGASPAQIDAAVEAHATLGMAMGPCRMLDMAGLDVGAKVVSERASEGKLPPDPAYRCVVRRLHALSRLGQKSGAGYYRYEGRTALPDPEVAAFCAALALEHGVVRRSDISDEEIVERLLYPLINEGARILEEGIAYRAGDIDVVWCAGYGFPDHRGGPMFMAGQLGLGRVAARMAHYAATRGNGYGYWSCAPLLARLAATGAGWQVESY